MNSQRKSKKLKEFGRCVICKVNARRSKTAKTCCQACAAKLAWKTRLQE